MTNLPPAVTRLIGRSAATARLRDLISAYRVVTLTGPGGIGKTSLALQVAREVAGEFSDGVCLVEMAPLADPGLVPSTVVQALGIELNHASADAIARAIGDQQLLLILDNCEHVISEASSLAESLVRTGSRITILATSRESLRVSGERVYRVPPLGVPAAQGFNALQILDHGGPELFVTRAKELGADFAWQATDLLMIADICRHLDGMPLAIEFAAARAATLGIAEVAGGLRDRFALLTSGRRTALPRHRTLHATLDWSYRLLSAAERGLLDRLAIFSGPFSIDGATAVASDNVSRGEAAPLVANLVDKSLVATQAAAFVLLETTRAYASERLRESGAWNEVARRHAVYFRDLFEQVEADSETDTTRQSRDGVELHIDNLRSALDWSFSADGDAEIGAALASAAIPVWLRSSLLIECRTRNVLAADGARRRERPRQYSLRSRPHRSTPWAQPTNPGTTLLRHSPSRAS